MIALDTNVLVRFLVDDKPRQARTAREFLEQLTGEHPGFVCREVIVELVWVLERACGFSRERIAGVLDALIATEELQIEASDDVARAALQYGRGGELLWLPTGVRNTSGPFMATKTPPVSARNTFARASC